jgi:ribonuclease J
MLDALQPQNVVPAHQDMSGYSPYVNLAENQGYKVGRDLHISRNGGMLSLVE